MKCSPLLLCLLAGCPWIDREDDTEVDSDIDTVDVDTDPDTDTDTDTYTDTDTDTYTDTDTDTDTDTEAPPIDLGTVRSVDAVGFDGFDGSISIMIPTAAPVVSGLASGAGAQVQAVAGGAMVTLDPTQRDWRVANPQRIDVELTLEGAAAVGQWQVVAVPEQVVLTWNDDQVFMALPVPLAPADPEAMRFSVNSYAPVSEASPGLWALSGPVDLRASQLRDVCVTAGSNGLACMDSASVTYSGAISTEVAVFAVDDTPGRVTLLSPFDWNQDSTRDAADLGAWLEGPPCRELGSFNYGDVQAIGPVETQLIEPVQTGISDFGNIGAPVTQADAVISTYSDVGGAYQIIAPIPGATAEVDADELVLTVPASAYDFRQTNPSTVHVQLTATDDGGRCYTRAFLWTTVAVPSVVATMWIDGQGYLGAGGVVAPRSGNALYFDGGFGNFGPGEEVLDGVFALNGGEEPDGRQLNLLYYSAGRRYATSFNEALAFGFSQVGTDTDPLVMRGNVAGGGTLDAHFVPPFDYSGDGVVTPEDLAVYLEMLDEDSAGRRR